MSLLDTFIFGTDIELFFECQIPSGTELFGFAKRGGVQYDFITQSFSTGILFKQESTNSLQIGDYDFILHWRSSSNGQVKGQACFKFKIVPLL